MANTIQRELLLVCCFDSYGWTFKSRQVKYQVPASFSALDQKSQENFLTFVDKHIQDYYNTLACHSTNKNLKMCQSATQNIADTISMGYLEDPPAVRRALDERERKARKRAEEEVYVFCDNPVLEGPLLS